MATNTFSGKVAAIDLRTTFCSLSYQVPGYERKTLELSGDYSLRIPTALLVKRTGSFIEVVDIGSKAQLMYRNLSNKKYKKYVYFEHFKMKLRDESKLSRESLISAYANDDYYITEVIALVLQHLRKELEEHLDTLPYEIRDGSRNRKLTATDFQWVLTVPAIWKDRGKQMMREAAYKAGLLAKVPEINSFTVPPAQLPVPNIPSAAMDKLVLALEPECAALYCQQMTGDMVAKYSDPPSSIASKCNMVLDVEEYNVNVHIIYEAQADLISLPPRDNDCGGATVNREFSRLLQRMVGDDEFSSFCNSPGNEGCIKAVITNLELEEAKINFGKETAGDDELDFIIRLDPTLAKFYERELTSASASRYGVQYEDDTIVIPHSKMKEIFQPAVSGILSCMNSALSASPVSIDTIYLVGGFGGCPYIYKKVKAAVERKNIRVVVPRHHRIAVVEGAVIFGQRKSASVGW